MRDLIRFVAFLLAISLTGARMAKPNNARSSSARAKANSTNGTREGKFFSLFSVIQFENSACNSTTDGREGLCYTSSECQNSGGKARGECAQGFGVCCIFEYTCSDSQSDPKEIVYFQSPSYPVASTEPQICLFSISIKDSTICQLRLDFLDFELDPGSEALLPCDRDSLEVMSSGLTDLNIGLLCGDNTGQHIYLPVRNQETRPMLKVITDSRTQNLSMPYKYNIKATQIDCSREDQTGMIVRAPDNCLQYFTERSGTFSSFNWSPSSGRIYSPNQDYAICFRRDFGDCELLLRRSSSAPAMTTSVGKATETTRQICGNDNGCSNKECIVQDTTNNNLIRSDRLEASAFFRRTTPGVNLPNTGSQYSRANYFCGVGLGPDNTGANNQPGINDGTDSGEGIVVQTRGPFVVRFVTDGNPPVVTQANPPTPLRDELGFSLDYEIQNGCRNLQEAVL